MSVIVIGADGKIGHALLAALRQGSEIVHATSRRPDAASQGYLYLDLADSVFDQAPLPKVEVVFICAALTSIAECEANPALARRINVQAPVALANRFGAAGARSIFLSTDAVYDGTLANVPADQPPSPSTEYGRLKAEAEAELLKLGGAVSVLRLTKVLAPDFGLFTGWIDTLANGGGITAFSDLMLAPISLGEAVDALSAVAKDRSGGIYQASAAADITYLDAAHHIADRLRVDRKRVKAQRGIDNGIPPDRLSRYASLDTSRLFALTGHPARAPREVIDDVYGPLLGGARSRTL